MIDWMQNPHAGYVVAAYVIAITGFVVFAVLSWMGMRARDKELQRLQQRNQEAQS